MPDWATGVISGVFDGVPFTAYTYLEDDGGGGHVSTATWDDYRNAFSVRLNLLATPTKDFSSFEQRIDLEMWLDEEFNPEPGRLAASGPTAGDFSGRITVGAETT